MEDKIDKLAWDVMERVTDLPAGHQYVILFGALEEMIKGETDRGFLALIATQLYELSELALKRSGVEVISEGNDTIN